MGRFKEYSPTERTGARRFCCLGSVYPTSVKTLLRILLYLSLIVWLGAEIFFPIVAAVTFPALQPDTHSAGTIVGQLIRILHGMGLVSGMVALAVMALAPAWGVYKPRAVLAPMILVVLMLACTVYSQFDIIPDMERDRIASGGAIDVTDSSNAITVHFNKLHRQSEYVEEAVLLLGLATVVLIARAETTRS
jgi:hypothetical protein